ncbi:MAG: flagellar biosynthetic protein FliO [Azovibrio sp.]|nr:flagellar biosynthetic protein FliO [Azovibrio sp.]
MHRLTLLLLLLPQLARAESAEPGVASAAFFQAMLGLALIIALLLLLAFLGRRFLGGKGFGAGGLKLLGGVALGPKERIVLLEAGEHWLVVGIVPGQIRTLHTMPKGELPPGEASAALSFSHWMQQFTEKRPHEN